MIDLAPMGTTAVISIHLSPLPTNPLYDQNNRPSVHSHSLVLMIRQAIGIKDRAQAAAKRALSPGREICAGFSIFTCTPSCAGRGCYWPDGVWMLHKM